jgi:uncharacterized protein (TIGR03067 family)
MRASLSTFVVLLGASAGVAGEAATSAGDLGRLQGKWTAMAGTRREIRVVMEINGREVKVAISTPQGLNIKAQGELKLDESTTPRSLDWVKFSGPDQQPFPAIAAVYKLEGETFTVCNGGFLGARPKDFKPGEGALADVVVFRRPGSTETKPSTTQKSGAAAPLLTRRATRDGGQAGASSVRTATVAAESPMTR